jgi:hypothetical protein
MSDYVSYGSIALKNKIMTPQVLDMYRNDTLNLSSIQGTIDPLIQIYKDTYKYIDYPDLSPPVQELIKKADYMQLNSGIPSNNNPYIYSNQIKYPDKSVDGDIIGPATYGPMTSANLNNKNFTNVFTAPNRFFPNSHKE